MIVRMKSKWEFDTSSSAGIGVEFVVAEGGSIYLKDPSGQRVTFRYGAAGAGWSTGLKLPKIGKLQLKGRGVGAAVAPAAFPNIGCVYILDSFPGSELTRSDITGVCVFAEIGGGVVVGGSGTAMLMGMDPALLAAMMASALVPPAAAYFDYELFQSATSVLIMAGINAGIQAGYGIAGYVGGLW